MARAPAPARARREGVLLAKGWVPRFLSGDARGWAACFCFHCAGGLRGGVGGYLARDSISRLNLGISGSIRSRSHELHIPESRVRTSGHSLSHPPRIHGPESGGAPAKSTGVRCAETRIQSPESTTEAEERGADPQIPESALRRHAQGNRGRAGAQDTGSGLSGEGSAWGRAQRGREGEGGFRS